MQKHNGSKTGGPGSDGDATGEPHRPEATRPTGSEERSRLRINWILPRVGVKGGVKSNRLIAEAMVRRGHEVNIAYVAKPRPWPRPWRVRRFARRLNASLRTMGRQRHHLERSSARLIPVHRDRIEPDDVPDADVTIATWWQTREWIEPWPASKGVKAYFIRHYEIHGGEPERVRATYRLPGLKLVIARWLQRLMAEEFNDPNAVLVPNGVDWTQFGAEPRGRGDPPTVGLVYSPKAFKAMDTAMHTLRLARQRMPELRILVFGSFPIARRFQPPEGIEFHLRPPQERLPELYSRADCWLLPSRSEGFGMPGLEAAACRCPVVATRCGGPEDYVEPGVNGHLVDVDDTKAMAEAIVEVLSQPEADWRQMSEASHAIARRFDWDRSAQILEKALLNAVRGTPARPRLGPGEGAATPHQVHNP